MAAFQPIPTHGRFQDITGLVFGRLTVIGFLGQDRWSAAIWQCRCRCGTELPLAGKCLKAGETMSCGCFQRECAAASLTVHGMSRTPIYQRWAAMIKRTTDTNYPGFADYGGRGITVCERWRTSFQNFYDDMGATFRRDLSLDRIDNDGNYEPANCRWATNSEQARNRRSSRLLTVHGVTRPLIEWAEMTGINADAIRLRLKHGWSMERAVTTPLRKTVRRCKS
jgi:hypothetical protein